MVHFLLTVIVKCVQMWSKSWALQKFTIDEWEPSITPKPRSLEETHNTIPEYGKQWMFIAWHMSSWKADPCLCGPAFITLLYRSFVRISCLGTASQFKNKFLTTFLNIIPSAWLFHCYRSQASKKKYIWVSTVIC